MRLGTKANRGEANSSMHASELLQWAGCRSVLTVHTGNDLRVWDNSWLQRTRPKKKKKRGSCGQNTEITRAANAAAASRVTDRRSLCCLRNTQANKSENSSPKNRPLCVSQQLSWGCVDSESADRAAWCSTSTSPTPAHRVFTGHVRAGSVHMVHIHSFLICRSLNSVLFGAAEGGLEFWTCMCSKFWNLKKKKRKERKRNKNLPKWISSSMVLSSFGPHWWLVIPMNS